MQQVLRSLKIVVFPHTGILQGSHRLRLASECTTVVYELFVLDTAQNPLLWFQESQIRSPNWDEGSVVRCTMLKIVLWAGKLDNINIRKWRKRIGMLQPRWAWRTKHWRSHALGAVA